MGRYDSSWEFATDTDAYLTDTFQLFGAALAKGQDIELMTSGMNAIVEELHGRALLIDAQFAAARTPVFPVRQAPYGRKVCTVAVTTPDGETECGATAVETWGASCGGIVFEEGRCLTHN